MTDDSLYKDTFGLDSTYYALNYYRVHITSTKKFSNFTVDRDHKKVRKQGWSPTPADILLGI